VHDYCNSSPRNINFNVVFVYLKKFPGGRGWWDQVEYGVEGQGKREKMESESRS
jgi:hypothetical protein